MSFTVKNLPPGVDLESRAILKKVASANRFLAELKGVSESIPNQGILINTLALQEAKDSSAIENIITTHDELFREELYPGSKEGAVAKEVQDYVSALRVGFELVKNSEILTENHILNIQSELEKNRAGYRKLPGTKLKNELTGEVIYTPPQHYDEIVKLMRNLVEFINDDQLLDVDYLIKMAIVHYQFETIHPFYDGNGRTGRIINILYLVNKGLLSIPVLYLSRYIIKTKSNYYELLQKVRIENAWEDWIVYILTGIEVTARQTIGIIHKIREELFRYKHHIRKTHKFYSQDLINNLFFHPYTKIEYLMRDLQISRHTASKYLDSLSEDGLLEKKKQGRHNYYINTALFSILTAIDAE